MSIAASSKDRQDKAPALRDGLARLRFWRDERRTVYAHFMRNFLTGAITTVVLRAEIAVIDETVIILNFEGGRLRTALAEARIFDGPMTFIDAVSDTREDVEAVQIKTRGGDSLLISTEEFAENDLVKIVSQMRRLSANE